jgi:tRNA isopentenyl-2-thiomethyl-A-37 hydroxylase MiaE
MGKRKAKPRAIAPRVPVELIERRIYLIRGQRVMLDADLAELYSVETRTLVQAVKRNRKRFPTDFMFPLTLEETDSMRSQIVIASKRNIRHRPYAFTEHGVAMLSAVLRSEPAVMMSILIVRAFIILRNKLANDHDLRSRVGKLESGQRRHSSVIRILANEVTAMKRLPPAPPKPPIGFKPHL